MYVLLRLPTAALLHALRRCVLSCAPSLLRAGRLTPCVSRASPRQQVLQLPQEKVNLEELPPDFMVIISIVCGIAGLLLKVRCVLLWARAPRRSRLLGVA